MEPSGSTGGKKTKTFVVLYSEVALKGKNRPEFVRVLRRNIRRALGEDLSNIALRDGRIFVEVSCGVDKAASRLSKVFGIAWFTQVTKVPHDVDSVRASVLALASSSGAKSFRISPRRSDKTFPLGSRELAVRLGSDVVKATGMKVDLSAPEVTLYVDVIKDQVLVYSDRHRGPGGLPVGTAGRVLHLFSGGIDSPVAAWLLMKRGCNPVYLHFYLAPTPKTPAESKITRLVKVLSEYGGKATLVLVPFADYQLATMGIPGELEPSLFRRFMRLTAEALAEKFGASGIATGDSLSQAASQTLWNIRTFDEGSPLPILRPLLTYDKEEIVTVAKSIGTYELSLEEYKDCCAIITKHPRTRANGGMINEFVERSDLRGLARRSLTAGTLFTYDPSNGETKVVPMAEVLRRERREPMKVTASREAKL